MNKSVRHLVKNAFASGKTSDIFIIVMSSSPTVTTLYYHRPRFCEYSHRHSRCCHHRRAGVERKSTLNVSLKAQRRGGRGGNDDDADEEALTEYEKKLLRQKETRDTRNAFIGFSLGAALVATIAVSSSTSGVYNIDFMDAFHERDPVRSFTVYGDVSKEYKVNKYDDVGHIIGRTRGVSVTSCAQLVPYSGDSRGDKGITRPPNEDFRSCEIIAQPLEKVETVADIAPSCERACGRSCREATKAYDEDQKKRFGFGFDKEEEGKVLQACGRQCNANCIKSGTGQYNFLVPFRF